jgi:hypothetical protein
MKKKKNKMEKSTKEEKVKRKKNIRHPTFFNSLTTF